MIEIKENGRTVSHTAIESLRRTYRASTNTIKAQNSFGVNSNDMQNGEKNSQFSFESELPDVDDAIAEVEEKVAANKAKKQTRSAELRDQYRGVLLWVLNLIISPLYL